MSEAAARAGFETRWLEAGGRIVEAKGPSHWADARLEAWIDWAGGETDMAAAISDYVETLAARAQARGLVKDVRARARFRQDLTAALETGAIAIGPVPSDPPVSVVDASAQDAHSSLDRIIARHRGETAVRAAAAGLGRRLTAVMDAVARCEGAADACADPARNPGLARACEAARAAGAGDDLLLETIGLARAGETRWAVEPLSSPSEPQLILAGPASRKVALAAWITGSVTLAADLRMAHAIAAAQGGLPGGVSLMAFWTDDGFDIAAFETAVTLLAKALGAAADGPVLLGLAGLGDWLAAHGLDYDSDRGRETAAELYRAAADAIAASGAVLDGGLMVFSNPELSLRLGGGSLAAEPWAGPVRLAETEDGETVRVLAEAALRGLALAGADVVEAQGHILGRSELSESPGINHAALSARGFTSHEIAAAEAALPLARHLSEAFRPAVIGDGFIRDVLGASPEQLADPDLDVLALAGFSEADVAAAERHVLGAGDLADADFLSTDQQLAFRLPSALGEHARLAMAAPALHALN